MTALAGSRPSTIRRRRVAALAVALVGLASGGLVVVPSSPVGATGPAPAVSASAMVGLHRGDRGAAVTALQQRLVAFGYVLSVDGVFGSATERAVTHFQRSNQLDATGIVSAATARYLGVAAGATAAPASSTDSSAASSSVSSASGLRRGSQGASVRALQTRLDGFGYVVEHDGVFGRLTERAVEHFQRANGLTPSGVVDAATAGLLGVSGASSAASAGNGSESSATPASSGGGMRPGSQGASVRALQTRLAGFGYVVEHDGVFGRLTERAVKHFQRVSGLTPSGVVDAATARVLGLSGATASTSASSGDALSVGSQGSAVARIQQQLQRAGFTVVGGADGSFGPYTRSAVRAFQRANGLTVTGRVDAATASALGAGGSRPSVSLTTPTPAANRASNAGAIAVAAAMSQRGVAYRFAAAKPGIAFDCSGLTAWAWAQAGVRLPFQSALQYATIAHVPVMNVRPGDLIFFHSPISHVAMYIGNNRIIDAMQPGTGVIVRAVNWRAVVGIGRPG